MLDLSPEPLSAAAFQQFGKVGEMPRAPGRADFSTDLRSGRAAAQPNLSIVRIKAFQRLPLAATQLERHEFSSQTFLPLDVSRWLLIVCPHAQGGGPDIRAARAFVAGPTDIVTYRMNTWHHSLTVLDRPASFGVLMWRDGSALDEEFLDLPEVLRVQENGFAPISKSV
jgi:ureidoglycolate lyase